MELQHYEAVIFFVIFLVIFLETDIIVVLSQKLILQLRNTKDNTFYLS